jgi:hypothetical protein
MSMRRHLRKQALRIVHSTKSRIQTPKNGAGILSQRRGGAAQRIEDGLSELREQNLTPVAPEPCRPGPHLVIIDKCPIIETWPLTVVGCCESSRSADE